MPIMVQGNDRDAKGWNTIRKPILAVGAEIIMSNDDTLLVALFKEIAVVHGKRSPDGQWTDANPWHVQNALEIAMRILKAANQSAGGSSDPAPAIQISKPSSPVVNAGATNRDTSLEDAVRRPTKQDRTSVV